MKSYSRKQAGVIYRAIKEGRIEMEKDFVSEMYDMVDEVEVFSTSSLKVAEEKIAAIKNAIDSIFEGNYESAQVSINNFCNA